MARFGVLAMTASSLLSATVSFIVNIISARALGPEFRGNVATVLQLAYLTAPLIGFGVDRALLLSSEKSAKPSDKSENGTQSSSSNAQNHVLPTPWAPVVISIILALVIGVVYDPWIALAAPAALVAVLFSWFRADALSTKVYAPYLLCFVAYQGSILAGSAAMWRMGVSDWRYWAGVYVFPALLLGAFGAWRIYRRRPFPLALPLEAWKRNGALQLSGMFKLISQRFNRVVLPLIAGPTSLGFYIVVATSTEPLYWLSQAMADVRTTAGIRGSHGISFAKELGRACLRVFIPLGIVGGTLLYFILVPLFGEEYIEAKPLVLPLTISAIALAAFRMLCGLLLAGPGPRVLRNAEAAAAISAIVLSPVSIWMWGAMGAAWSSVMVYLIGITTGLIMSGQRKNNLRSSNTAAESIATDDLDIDDLPGRK